VVANVAVEEIATVLRDIPLTQPQRSETPELSGSADAQARTVKHTGLGHLAFTTALVPGPSIDPRSGRGWPSAVCLCWLAVPSVRPSPLMTLLPTSGMVAQCYVAAPSSGSGVLRATSHPGPQMSTEHIALV